MTTKTQHTAQEIETLHKRPIYLKDAKTFSDIFASAALRNISGKTRPAPLAVVPSWEAGTWSDKRSRSRCEISSCLQISGADTESGYRWYTISLTPEALETVKAHVLMCKNGSVDFGIHIWDNGQALVTAQQSLICGSSWLAIIDASTIPVIDRNS